MAVRAHQDLTRKIIGCAFHVQNALGCGFLEKVYENAIMVALGKAGLEAAQQVPLRVHYEGVLVGDYFADIIVAKAVLVEIKAAEANPPIYVAQVLNYLKATNLPVGLLLNFGQPRLFYRRLTLRAQANGHTEEDASGNGQVEERDQPKRPIGSSWFFRRI